MTNPSPASGPVTHPQRPDIGLSVAVAVANRAVTRVPAYPKLLSDNGITGDTITEESFAALPPMTKDDYLLRHPRADLVWDGDLGDVVNWSASSGSTGTPSYWPRSRLSLYDSIRFHERILRDSFDAHQHTTLVINTFAMGNWIGGTYTLIAINGTNDLDLPVSIISPGMSIEEAARAFTDLGPDYQQVVIAGYPPFVKGVIDEIAPEALSSQRVRLLLAGESITERWRTALLEKIDALDDPRAVTLIYGTADAGMMGFETPASIAIRRAADADPVVAHALFGADLTQLPTFAEYDPIARYVETDQKGFLLFTIDSTLPLVRYRIQDYGLVYDATTLRDVLISVGRDDLAHGLPDTANFLTVSGRAGVEITLNGLNLYTANFAQALEDDRLFNLVTTYFYVPSTEQGDLSQRFEIQVELKKGIAPCDDLRELLTAVFVESLRGANSEYRKQYGEDPEFATPQVVLAEYEARAESAVKRRPFRKPQ